ncbi:hypothetical protein QOZ80_6AG0517480 [Eleusine coracana subsp. coracana]|nr:hypothetical protein QOZ80_6AG0517480 [Eleusine coracana subsp. coracana]
MNLPFKGILRDLDDDSAEAQRRKWFKEMRGWLMVLTTVAASVTYQAGLNPPGGFWQDDPRDKSHHAGDPALHDEHHSRYMIFYYFNATAFVTSLVIMVLLMSERFYHTEDKVLALLLATIVDLASLIGAYIAGTTRYFSSCIYIIVITCVAFVAVIYIGEGITEICIFIMKMLPCMEKLAESRWCPIPARVVTKAKMLKDDRQRRKRNPGNTRTCCLCCA